MNKEERKDLVKLLMYVGIFMWCSGIGFGAGLTKILGERLGTLILILIPVAIVEYVALYKATKYARRFEVL